ncbi:MAG: histidine kinase dimerization/phospho-acceptor domain-containing protein [Propionivibrio sp.]
MVSGPVSGANQVADSHWKSLRYFNGYRVCIAVLLFVSSLIYPSSFSLIAPERGSHHLAVTSLYLVITLISLVGVNVYRRRFNLQLSVHVLVDIAVFTLLMNFGGGVRSGMGILLLVSLAGSGLVGQGRLVLFYAATATLAVLYEQTYRAITSEFETADFFQTGLFCAGFFGIATLARLVARRVIANEELARKRGIDLRNQTLISQRIIEQMQDGVLVIDRAGLVRQNNPRAARLLGLSDPAERRLTNYSTELARSFLVWCERPSSEPVLVRAPASGMQLRARFVSTDSSERDVLVFLEDTGRLQEQARQLKLAALGRLTANIAHEIRNPLSAINHAGELLREENRDEMNERLLRIVLDNTNRVERIVSDVLELGRRDRAHRELIDLRQTLLALVDEYTAKERIASEVVRVEIDGEAKICFDRAHFYQVLGNLLGNALRHSQKTLGSVRLVVSKGKHEGWIDLHVVDDGPGVDEVTREQIFEPFFTTHSRGTGLGLYIARELCEANAAQLELRDSDSGADFCISGRFDECQ